MSLEAKIQELTETVSRLIDVLNAQPVPMVSPAPVPVQSNPVNVPVAPVQVEPVAAPDPVAPAAPVMPAPPVFTAPAAPGPVSPNGAPFSDGKGLIDYVMGAYRAMGPQKGAQIQNVLVSLGYQNINDVKPEHYGALYTGVEALK